MEESDAITSAMRAEGLRLLRFERDGRTVRRRAPGSEEDRLAAVESRVGGELDAVSALVLAGGHERLDLIDVPDPGFRLYVAVHSTRRGRGAGGLRRHDLVTPERTVIDDVLNLARAMSLKNAAAELDYGGAKLALHASPLPNTDRELWLDALVEAIDAADVLTGPDSGLSGEVYAALAARSENVVGVRAGGTSPSAALGVFESLRATAAALGAPLSDLHVAVQGLGELGMRLADQLVVAGARLTVTDRDHRRIDALLAGTEAEKREQIQVVAPYQILETPADVLSPCAVGGLLDGPAIDALRVRAVCGGANNQLAARTIAEEVALARRLHGRGILFVPDWLASAGGTIHGTLEAEDGEAFDVRKARARIHRVCGWLVDEILETAKRTSTTPLEVALRRLL